MWYAGAVHHDDLLYLFVNLRKALFFTDSDPEIAIVERLTRFLTKFAIDGYDIIFFTKLN